MDFVLFRRCIFQKVKHPRFQFLLPPMYFFTYFTLCDNNETVRCATYDLLRRSGNARNANTLHGGDTNVISLEIFAREQASGGTKEARAGVRFDGVRGIHAG